MALSNQGPSVNRHRSGGTGTRASFASARNGPRATPVYAIRFAHRNSPARGWRSGEQTICENIDSVSVHGTRVTNEEWMSRDSNEILVYAWPRSRDAPG